MVVAITESIINSMDMSLSKLQEDPGVLQSWGPKESDTPEQLNNRNRVITAIEENPVRIV